MKCFFLFIYGLRLNDSASPLFEKLLYFHDISINILIFVSVFVGGVIYSVLFRLGQHKTNLENKFFEIGWTIIPALILIFLSVPSLSLLYFVDLPQSFRRNINLGNLIKVIGHQWYWSYEYSVQDKDLVYDSFLIPANELPLGGFRLLETDKPLIVRALQNNIIQGTSDDVIHSWACPSLGIKFDVVPGRLKRFSLILTRAGTFFGQCSEICGANHRFMPIEIERILS